MKVWRSNAGPCSGCGVRLVSSVAFSAYWTSGMVLYAKVVLSFSKSEHGTLTGGYLDYIPTHRPSA